MVKFIDERAEKRKKKVPVERITSETRQLSVRVARSEKNEKKSCPLNLNSYTGYTKEKMSAGSYWQEARSQSKMSKKGTNLRSSLNRTVAAE